MIVTLTLSEPASAGVISAPTLMLAVHPGATADATVGAPSPSMLPVAATLRSDTPCTLMQPAPGDRQVSDSLTGPGTEISTGTVTLTAACAEATPGTRATPPASVAAVSPARTMNPARICYSLPFRRDRVLL